jgi:ribosomal protein S18 acetylase RimI-like enzyme
MDTTPHQTLTRADLSIRPAQPADRPALEAIARQTWDGDDYLPRVLEDWFSDPHGGFFVALLRDRVIGAGKVTRFAAGEWWLEGLRIAPAYRGHGFARILHHFLMNQVRQMGSGIVRFSTASVNEPVQRLAKETGFARVATFLPYGADPLAEPVRSWWALGPNDAARVQRWLDQSAHFSAVQRSFEWDWSYYLLTRERLADHLADGRVYGWPHEGDYAALGGVVLLNPADKTRWPGEPTLKIAYFDADDLTAAARDVRRLAAALERVRVQIKAFDQPDRIAALEQSGYEREWDGAAWLYARDIRLTDHADVLTEN